MKTKKLAKKLALKKKTIDNLNDAEMQAVNGGDIKPTTPVSRCLACQWETQTCEPWGSCPPYC